MSLDSLETLPVDTNPLSVDEVMVLNALPREDDNLVKNKKLIQLVKFFLVIVGLFVIFSLPIIDRVICGFFPSLQRICLIVKALLFGVVISIINYYI